MNFVCLVFELGDKTLTLSPMENLMVKCNRIIPPRVCGGFPMKSNDVIMIDR